MEELIYNDLDTGLSNLMLCATDIDYLQAAIDKAYELQFDIQKKEDFNYAINRREDKSTSIIEFAALTLVVILFGRAADRQNFIELTKIKGINYQFLLVGEITVSSAGKRGSTL